MENEKNLACKMEKSLFLRSKMEWVPPIAPLMYDKI